MTERSRYRVTGSVFLVALAIIVLPMLFDGEGAPAVQLAPLEPPRELPVEVAPADAPPPADEFVAAAEKLRAAVDEDGFHKDTQTLFGEPVLFDPNRETRVFAVQVGSFTALANATGLRDRLRTDGYEAFLSTYRPDGSEIVNRVAVGPLLSEADAQALRTELSRRYSTNARLMGFGN